MDASDYQANQWRLAESEWLLLLFEREHGRPAASLEEIHGWTSNFQHGPPRLQDASEADRDIVFARRAAAAERRN